MADDDRQRSSTADGRLPGKGLFGWLGRQVGHVAAAIRHDPMTVAKKTEVDDRRDPAHPGVVFRRTVVDEVRRDEVDPRADAQLAPPEPRANSPQV